MRCGILARSIGVAIAMVGLAGCYRSHGPEAPRADASVPVPDAMACSSSPGRDVELAGLACGLPPSVPPWCVFLEIAPSGLLLSVTRSGGPIDDGQVACIAGRLAGRCYTRPRGAVLEVCPLT